MTDNPRVWTLEVATFRGSFAIGATHSYATLCSPDPEPMPSNEGDGGYFDLHGTRYPINMILDAEQAAELNRINAMFGRDYSADHEAGEPSHQFNNDDEAERFGTFVWSKLHLAPEAVLFRGSGYGVNGPSKVLGGPEAVVFELNRIWEQWDKDESDASNRQAEDLWAGAFTRLGLDDLPNPEGMKFTRAGVGSPEKPRDIKAYVADRDGELVLVDPHLCTCAHENYEHKSVGRSLHHTGACSKCECSAFVASETDVPNDDF